MCFGDHLGMKKRFLKKIILWVGCLRSYFHFWAFYGYYNMVELSIQIHELMIDFSGTPCVRVTWADQVYWEKSASRGYFSFTKGKKKAYDVCYNNTKFLLELKWMVQCHKDVYQNSRLRLEYAYLLLNKFIMNRINSELIKIGRILTSFSVTESSCDDTSRANKKKSAKQF